MQKLRYLVLIRFGPPQLSDIIWYLNAMTWVWFFSIQTLMCTHVMVIKPTPFRDYMSPPQTPLWAHCCYSIPLWKMVDFDKAELSNHGALFCPCTIWALLEAMISLIPASRFLLWGLWILGKISAAIGGPNMLVYHVWCAVWCHFRDDELGENSGSSIDDDDATISMTIRGFSRIGTL